MKRFRSTEMQEAYKNGGYRERYAMENGNKTVIFVNGEKCFKFTYSENKKYQDANGAVYNTVSKSWVD